jgi:hypothetical protein
LEEENKAMVLEAFDTLFNQRDYPAAERLWPPDGCVAKTILSANRTDRQSVRYRLFSFSIRGFPG